MSSEIGPMLAELRGASKLTQREVAERMSANQTRVSRIEAGDGEADDVATYLEALGTSEAAALAGLLQLKWRHLPRPSLRHPDLPRLVEIERGLERLQSFLEDGQVPTILSGQAQLLYRRLGW